MDEAAEAVDTTPSTVAALARDQASAADDPALAPHAQPVLSQRRPRRLTSTDVVLLRRVLCESCTLIGAPPFSDVDVARLLPYASKISLCRYQVLWRRLGDPINMYYIVVRGMVRVTGLGVTRHQGPGTGIAGGAWMRENLHLNEATATEPTELIAVRADVVKAAGRGFEELCERLRASVGFRYSMMLLSTYIPYFVGHPQGVVRKLAKLFRMRVFQRGEVLHRQGEPAREVFFLVVGEVVMREQRPDGGVLELSRVNERADYTSIGELALVGTKKHRATHHHASTVVAEERSLLFEVSATDYFSVLNLIPTLRAQVESLKNLQTERADGD